MAKPSARQRHGGAPSRRLRARPPRGGAGADRPARGFPVRRRARRHRARHRRADQRRRAYLHDGRRHGRRLHDGARPGAGAARQARAGGDRRRRAADERRRARDHRRARTRPISSIVCVDNGHYGETGYQKSHTSLGVDLEKIAAGSGIKRTRTIASEADIAEGARLLREGNGTAFVLLRVKPTDPPTYKRNLDPSMGRLRFRQSLLGRP